MENLANELSFVPEVSAQTEQKEELKSVWKGSEKTFEMVAEQIAERWGEEEVENYDPETNCFTFNRWKQEGFQVMKGEKSLTSITWIVKEVKNELTGEMETRKFPRKVCLFYYKQVKKIEVAN